MPTYQCTFLTKIHVVVEVDAPDDVDACDLAWEIAEEYLQTIGTQTGSDSIVSVEASLDGIGADEVTEV